MTRFARIFDRYRDLVPDFAGFLDRVSEPPPQHVRVNTLKADVDFVAESLATAGIETVPEPWFPALLKVSGASGTPLGATLLHALGWMPLYFAIDLLGLPSLLILLLLGIYARRVHEHTFLRRLWVGLLAGASATAAYDLSRLLIRASGMIAFDPFLSHPIFGMLITGARVESMRAIVVGWGYHFWNGLGFGIMYTLVAGPAHWAYAMLWALMLELAWLTAMPAAVELRLHAGLVIVGVIGHLAYGAALAGVGRRQLGAA